MPNLKDYQLEIEKLISEQNWSKAYTLCNKILIYDPENTKLIRLKSQIEHSVNQLNANSIRKALSELDPLLKEERYEEYLKQIAPLQSYIPDFPEIGEKIWQVKKLLDKSYQLLREKSYHELIDRLKKKKKHDYEQSMIDLQSLLRLKIHEKDILSWIKKIQQSHITDQIERNQALINSNKFEDTLLFLLKLKKIDPRSAILSKLIGNVNLRYRDYKIENTKDYLFKTLEEIKTLYLTGKYEYCIDLCQRVLRIDSRNKSARHFLNLASYHSDINADNKITNDILANHRTFKQSPAYQSGEYVSI